MRDWDKGRTDDEQCAPVTASAGEISHKTPPKIQRVACAGTTRIFNVSFILFDPPFYVHACLWWTPLCNVMQGHTED